MKKFISAFIVVLLTSGVFAQSNLKPVIANAKTSFIQKGTTSTTVFTVEASSDEIKILKEQAVHITNIKLDADKQKGNVYACKLTITDRNESMYVQRIFSALGFSTFSINGVEKPVSELSATLAVLK
ncbi:MAG TPA: hypothetical protein VD905_02515 [Flavobacteriales bacterium]|nr:hypothetical protein [Flavobacteriales bacterium]